MSYPSTIDSFVDKVDYNQTFSEQLVLSASTIPFIQSVSHDILSNVSFNAVYTTEVSTTPGIGQFRVLYNTNKIELGPLSSPTTVTVTYKCKGDRVEASIINNVQDAVENIETVLGTNPQGVYPTVRDRISALEGSTGLHFTYKDFTGTPEGPDGTKTTFLLTYVPKAPETVYVYLNGLRQRYGTHYTVNGIFINFVEPPNAGDSLFVDYIY